MTGATVDGSRGASGDALADFVDDIVTGFGAAVDALGGAWTASTGLEPGADATTSESTAAAATARGTTGPPPGSTAFEELLGHAVWVSLALCVLALIGTGALLAVRARRGEGVAVLGRVGVVLVAVVIASGASAVTAALVPRSAPVAADSPIGTVQDGLWWYTGGFAVLAVVVAAARMAWSGRAGPARDLLQGLLTLVAVSGAGLTVVVLATSAADAFSAWVLGGAVGCDLAADDGCFGSRFEALIPLSADSAIGPVGVFVLGLVALGLSYTQLALLLVRGGMLVVLAGVLPAVAALGTTPAGRRLFAKAAGWTAAIVLYEPVAAIVYTVAFGLAGGAAESDPTTGAGAGDQLAQLVTGIAFLVVAVLALPALLRLASAATSALGRTGADVDHDPGGGGSVDVGGGAGGRLGGHSAFPELASGAVRAATVGGGAAR